MFVRSTVLRSLALLPVAALALTLTYAEPARALACDGTGVSITGSTTFDDCAGRTVTASVGSSSLVLSGSGPWDGDSPFSDLHVSVAGQGVLICRGPGNSCFDFSSFPNDFANSFFTNDDGDAWQKSAPGNSYSFIANDASERVFPGDDYSWEAHFSFNSGFPFGSGATVTIDYTMDVPEPALGVVLLGGLAAVGLARRRRR